MTVNIYFLYCTANAAPAGWTEISASYQGRLIKLATSSFLTTAGSDTHTHTVNTKPTLASGGASNSANGTSGEWIGATAHTHSSTGSADTIDAGTDTSLPYYKNYRMIYQDSATFTGVVPAYCAIMRAALPESPTPDYDHWAWNDTANCYIRIASTYGGYGGVDSHTHPTTLVFANAIVSSIGRSSGSTAFTKGAYSHNHSTTGVLTDATAHTYKWWGAGVCGVSEATAGLPAGSYAWFDGAAPAGWTALSSDYNGYFCRNRSSADKTVAQGGNDATHSHTITGSTGGCSGTSQTAAGGSSAGLLWTHTHTITGGSYSSDLPTPSNFTLRMASNNADIVPMTTRTKSYTMDVLLQKVKTRTYTADLLIKKLGIQKTYAMDLLLRKNGLTKAVNMDILIRKTCVKSLNMDIILKKFNINKTYIIDILLQKTMMKAYAMDVLLKKQMIKTYGMDILLQKTPIKSYVMDIIISSITSKTYIMNILLKKTSIIKSYEMNLILQSWSSKSYDMDIYISKRNIRTYQLDMLLKAQNILPYDMNIVLKGSPCIRYAMGITLLSKSFYRRRRDLSMDNRLSEVPIERGYNSYKFDPTILHPEARRKRDIPGQHTIEPGISKGFDSFAYEDRPRKKREFSNAS